MDFLRIKVLITFKADQEESYLYLQCLIFCVNWPQLQSKSPIYPRDFPKLHERVDSNPVHSPSLAGRLPSIESGRFSYFRTHPGYLKFRKLSELTTKELSKYENSRISEPVPPNAGLFVHEHPRHPSQ